MKKTNKSKRLSLIIAVIAMIITLQVNVNAQNNNEKGEKNWTLTGNTLIGTEFIGSTNNKPFIIKTNNVERLRISENGNVGIGLTNASEKLEVNGGLKLNAITPGISSNGTIIFDGNEFLMRKNGQWMSLVYKSPWDTNSVSVYTGRKVGIGVNDPKESLEISGGIKLGNYTNSKMKGDTTVTEDGTIIYDGSDLLGKVEGEWVSLTDGGSTTELWNLNATTSTVYCMSNKVGIGTNNAAANLHLKNISANDPELKMRYTHQYNSFAGWESYQIEPLTNDKGMGGVTKEVKISDIDIYNKWGILYFAIDGINKFGITSSTIQTGTRLLCEDDIISRKNIWVVEKVSIGKSYAYPGTWNEQFSVVGTTLLNGNVAIGTTETTASLNVNGNSTITGNSIVSGNSTISGNNIIAGNVNIGTGLVLYNDGKIWASTEITVNTANKWGDFVFDPSYKLKPLSEVETYIKANKHLEGIPSATEIEKNGVNLGEMSNTLTQKIEELTLYVIELNKNYEQLKKENEQMKQEIENLKK